MIDLTYECLEEMDNLIHQSARGIHVLFEKTDILRAIEDGKSQKDEYDIEKLKSIQVILYKFISLKSFEDKKDYIKTLSTNEYSLLIRAYFKIVENSMLNRSEVRH